VRLSIGQTLAADILQCSLGAHCIINLADYVASSLSSATTGAALRVDGGVVETIA
jgi:enoyl-[acyl-carrier-protein] reductase (NADH)